MKVTAIKPVLCMVVCLQITNCFNFGRTSGHLSDISQNNPDKKLLNYKDILTPRLERQQIDVNNSSEDVSLIKPYSARKKNPLTIYNVLTTSFSEVPNRIVSKGKQPLGKDNTHVNRETRHQLTNENYVPNQLDHDKGSDQIDYVNNHFEQKLLESFQSRDTTDRTDNGIKTKQTKADFKKNEVRIRRDVYSILKENFLKKHKLAMGNERDIKRLLETLAIIRDFLEEEKAAERRKAARLKMGPLRHRVGGQEPHSELHKPSGHHNNHNKQDFSESPRYEYQKQEPPSQWEGRDTPKHNKNGRNRHVSKSYRSSRKGEVNFGVRTSQDNGIDNFYKPEFNPTGW